VRATRRAAIAARRSFSGRPDGGEPAAVHQDFGRAVAVAVAVAAQLGRQLRAGQEALEDAVARAVVEDALVPALALDAVARRGVDDHQLGGRDAAGLRQEGRALLGHEVAVEVGGQDAVERAVGEGEGERVAGQREAAVIVEAVLGDGDHARRLVQADREAGEVAGQERGPAGDVERPGLRQRGDQRHELLDLVAPLRAVALGEAPGALVPLVVLGGAGLVVGVGGRIASESHGPIEANAARAGARPP
jgi:hypothetical protein